MAQYCRGFRRSPLNLDVRRVVEEDTNYSRGLTSFYDLETPRTFGFPNRIMRDTGTEVFKIHRIRTVQGKPRRIGIL